MKCLLFILTLLQLTLISIPVFPDSGSTPPTQAISIDSNKKSYTERLKQQSPLILSNHDLSDNTLKESNYELLKAAKSSILIVSYTFSEPEVIKIVNQKASEGVHVQLVIDRDHLPGSLHPSVKVSTRQKGEGHLHHKIMVIDNEYVWIGSANFTVSSFTGYKNLAVAFYSPEVAVGICQEALDIAASSPRTSTMPLTCSFGNQLLEVYILPHNPPEAPRPTETKINELGRQKLINLIENARNHIKASVAVWTYKDISRAIISAKQRGLQVDITVGDMNEEAVKMLIQAGIKVNIAQNLHQKFLLVDHQILLNGSPNWSINAFSRSDESFTVLYDLTQEQLKALEGPLKAAGLPLLMHVNEIEEQEAPNDEVAEKIELVNRTISALTIEINKIPTSQENKRLIAIAKRLSSDLTKFIPYLKTASVPGCCLYEGENYLANVVAIAEKQERVQAAVKYIKNAGGVDQKVADYFQKTLKKLQQGINAPLPDFFHATRAGFEGIVKSQMILQSKTGLTGPGTYISCNNEGDHGFGSHALAIDEGCLVDTLALFRTGRTPQGNVFFSLWASVLKDIPVTEDSIAFIDTSADDIPFVTMLLKQYNLNIEVIDRKTSEGILRIFDLTTKRRELPSFFWNKYSATDYLPQNMYSRSEQGTFRQFVF